MTHDVDDANVHIPYEHEHENGNENENGIAMCVIHALQTALSNSQGTEARLKLLAHISQKVQGMIDKELLDKLRLFKLSNEPFPDRAVRVKQPFVWGMRAQFNIYYNDPTTGDQDAPLYILTPIVLVLAVWRSGGGSDGGSGRDGASNQDYFVEVVCSDKHFLTNLHQLIDSVIMRAMRRKPGLFTGKNHHTVFPGHSTLRLRASQSILKTATKGSRCTLVFNLDNLWASNYYYGVDLVTHSVKPFEMTSSSETDVVPNGVEMDPDTDCGGGLTWGLVDGPVDIKKYATMIKLGVPADAVRHKMRFDGIADQLAQTTLCKLLGNKRMIPYGGIAGGTPPAMTTESTKETTESRTLIEKINVGGHCRNQVNGNRPPPPPPPPPPKLTPMAPTSSNAHADLMRQIKFGNFALKASKPAVAQTPEQVGSVPAALSKRSKSQRHGHEAGVPTLADILDAKKRLRRMSSPKRKTPPAPIKRERTFLDDIKDGNFRLVRSIA